ncbi:MAG: response regulator transcription factor [Lachnospiraceae bacterium]|nr:response regulator transcription factor [Candidatus Colinaster equi]
MNILICDDLASDWKVLNGYLERYIRSKNIICNITICESADALMIEIERKNIDLVFMDIYIHNDNGMDLAKRLQEKGYKGGFVFATTSSEYVLDSFLVNVHDYLIKPFIYERFEKTMDKIVRMYDDMLAYVTVSVQGGERKVLLRDIQLIETGGNHIVLVRTDTEDIQTKTRMSDVEAQLEGYKNFLKVHRSYIVNINHIKEINGEEIEMMNGAIAMITLRNLADIKKQITEYMWEKAMEENR